MNSDASARAITNVVIGAIIIFAISVTQSAWCLLGLCFIGWNSKIRFCPHCNKPFDTEEAK